MTDSIKKTIENLRLNNMEAYYCETSAQAKEKVADLLEGCKTVASGGSVTLSQIKVTDYITSGKFDFIDRNKKDATAEEKREIIARTSVADAYLMSSNAVTENGELYNVDGNSNRVSALLYGPSSVIIVVGVNKIVKNLDEAIRRVKVCAAPKNTVRLGCETPCSKTGECVSLLKENPEMSQGCKCNARICCNYVVCAQQRHKNRIKVIIVNEELGY